MMDVQATGEAFSPQNRTSNNSISSLLFYSVGHCCPPGSGSSRPRADPDPQAWFTLCAPRYNGGGGWGGVLHKPLERIKATYPMPLFGFVQLPPSRAVYYNCQEITRIRKHNYINARTQLYKSANIMTYIREYNYVYPQTQLYKSANTITYIPEHNYINPPTY